MTGNCVYVVIEITFKIDMKLYYVSTRLYNCILIQTSNLQLQGRSN